MKKIQVLLGQYRLVLIWGSILAVFAFTRVWRLTDLPSGLHLDEASMAYSAWCLSQYGVDRYLNSWPIYLLNFGGGQSPLYAYLLAGLFKIFGFHTALIRIPSVFFSLLSLVFTSAIAKMMFPSHKAASYITGALVVICPYYIMAGRLGLDCNLMLGCATVFFYCFLKAIDSEKKLWYALAGIGGGIMLYSYALSYVMLPLFLVFAVCYTVWTHKFSFVKWIIMAIPMGILAAPLILEQIVNIFGMEPIRLGIFTVTRMDSYRASEFGNFQIDSLKVALQDIFAGDVWLHNSIPGFYNLYWLSIPLAIAGLGSILWKLALSLRQRSIWLESFILFWFFSVLFVVCHIYPCINQVNSIFFAYTLLATEGILWLARLKQYIRKVISAAILLIYTVCFFRFGLYYFGGGYTADNYPMPYFDILITDAVKFIENNPQYGEKGVQMAESPVYLGLSTLYSPYELCLFDKELLVLEYYYCSHLGEIEDGYYYIVRDTFQEYADELRSKGYTEAVYNGYSLFYME